MGFLRTIACLGLFGTTVGAASVDGLPTFLGVTIGQPASELRATLGDPLLVTSFPDALVKAGRPAPPGAVPQRTARYWIPPGNTFRLVGERDGVVVSIELLAQGPITGPNSSLPADSAGVIIGMTSGDVIAHRGSPRSQTPERLVYDAGNGIFAIYDLQADLVHDIQYFLPPQIATSTINPNAGNGLAMLLEPAGTSTDTAIVDAMTDEDSGVKWEYIYLAFHPCDGRTNWKRGSLSTVISGSKKFDRMSLVCPTTQVGRDLYFDITSYFGKRL